MSAKAIITVVPVIQGNQLGLLAELAETLQQLGCETAVWCDHTVPVESAIRPQSSE